MTAIQEQPVRVRFLKIAAPNLIAWYMRGDSQHRNPVLVAVAQAVDQTFLCFLVE
jgi:hypothetical protein